MSGELVNLFNGMGVGTFFLIIIFVVGLITYIWKQYTNFLAYQKKKITEEINEDNEDQKTMELVKALSASINEIHDEIDELKKYVDTEDDKYDKLSLAVEKLRNDFDSYKHMCDYKLG